MNKKWILLFIPVVIFIVFSQLRETDDSQVESRQTSQYTTVQEEIKVDETQVPETEKEQEITFSSKEIEYEIEIIGEGFNIPWEILPLPDGRFLVTERPGRIVTLNNEEIYVVKNVEHIGEGGLLGMTISPDFENDNFLYIYYTYRDGNQVLNRVSRFTFKEDKFMEETYILDKIPGAWTHNGGRIKFGPDGKLYITTGDAQNPDLSQDRNSLAGKILRINKDGSIPEDNPFVGSPVYAFGLRNPQGLAWHPVTGELYASDHGPSGRDEINLISPGENYGWPIVTCDENNDLYKSPVVCYSEFTIAPSGVAFLSWDILYDSPLYVAGLRGNMIMRVIIDDEGVYIDQDPIINEYGRIRTVIYYKDYLYIATNNRDGRGTSVANDDRIIKVKPILPYDD